jgi:mannose-6-phosphate isomerase-like protein (cupin superfamily)
MRGTMRYTRPVIVSILSLLAVFVWGAVRAQQPAHVPSAAPAPYFVKSAASLADLEKTLAGKGAHSGDLLKPGATALEIVWRHEEDYEQAELELHDGKDHVFFVTDGQAAFTLGGELVAPREISAGEWKAKTSRNSEVVEARKGDLLFIPHGTVHGRSAKGQKFTMLQLSFWPGGAPAPRTAAAAPAPAPAGSSSPGPALQDVAPARSKTQSAASSSVGPAVQDVAPARPKPPAAATPPAKK